MSNSLEQREHVSPVFGDVNTHTDQGQRESEFHGLAPSFVSYADIERHGSLSQAIVAIRAEQAL